MATTSSRTCKSSGKRGWTRQQAIAYKIGQLKVRELRTYATQELGDKFNVRSFHDQILGNGSLPLDVLEKRIKDWATGVKPGKR